jgi:hypothetical protein
MIGKGSKAWCRDTEQVAEDLGRVAHGEVPLWVDDVEGRRREVFGQLHRMCDCASNVVRVDERPDGVTVAVQRHLPIGQGGGRELVERKVESR